MNQDFEMEPLFPEFDDTKAVSVYRLNFLSVSLDLLLSLDGEDFSGGRGGDAGAININCSIASLTFFHTHGQ